MFKFPEAVKLDSRALEIVLLDNMDFSIFKKLIKNDTGAIKFIDSRNVTFYEAVFPGLETENEHSSENYYHEKMT